MFQKLEDVLPEGYTIDYHNGLYYNIEDFDNFLIENKTVLIPDSFIEGIKPLVVEQYKNTKTGDYYSLAFTINQEIENIYRRSEGIELAYRFRVRNNIKFGKSIHDFINEYGRTRTHTSQ
jgi:hypothetical protein